MKLSYIFSIALLILLSAACQDINVTLEEQPGSLSGFVYPTDASASIALHQDQIIAQTIAGADGSFRIEDVPAGTYTVWLSADGYGSQKIKSVVVHEGENQYIGEHLLTDYPWPVRSVAFITDVATRSSSIAALPYVQIEFSEPVDEETLNASWTLTPMPTEYEVRYTNYSSQSRMRVHGAFALDSDYTFSMSTAATTALGLPLEFPLEYQFHTAVLRVEGVYLQNSRSYNSSVRILLNGAVDYASVMNYLLIDPVTDFLLTLNSYRDGTDITLQPTIGWRANTTTTVTLQAGLIEATGSTLARDTSFAFSMPQLALTNSFPQNGQTLISQTVYIRLQFNNAVDATSAQTAISMVPDSPPFTLVTSYPSEVRLLLADTLASQTTYTITIGADFKDYWGGSLVEPYDIVFTTL